MKLSLLVLCGLVAAASALPMTLIKDSAKPLLGDIWSDCSAPSDPLKILSVKITPDPPVKGQDVEVVADVKFGETVSGGIITVNIKWGIIPVYGKPLDLCTVLSGTDVKCPIAPGPQNATVKATIPSIAPSGHYTGSAVATDQNGKQLACINIDLHL